MSEATTTVEGGQTSSKKESAKALLQSVGVDVDSVSQDGGKKVEPPPLTARSFTLKDPSRVWYVNDTMTAADIATLSGGPANAVLALPKSGLLSAAATGLAVKVTAAEDGGFAAAEIETTVDVIKKTGSITWTTPPPLLKDATLTSKQNGAKPTPDTLPLVYSPSTGMKMTKVGPVTLSVTSPGNAALNAITTPVTTVLTVVATKLDLASAYGTIEMETGRAFLAPPIGSDAEKMVKKWDKDEGGVKTQALKIMTDVKDMTEDELITYMKGLKKDPNFHDFIQVTTGPKGGPSEYPNDILQLNNGLTVRYKPNGDQRHKGKPMFCLEVRTEDDVTKKQDSAAFKIMPDGQKAAKGPDDTILPDWIAILPDNDDKRDLKEAFMTAACAKTHLLCTPKLDQVITWPNPAEIDIGTKLLAATVLGGVKPKYFKGASAIAEDAILPGGDNQQIKVTTVATDRFKAGEKTFTISVKRLTQTVTWPGGPFTIFADAKLSNTELCATSDGPGAVSYTTEDGKTAETENVIGKLVSPGTRKLIAVAAASGDYDASAPVSVEFKVNRRPQVVTADPPDELTTEMTWGEILNISYLGKDDKENGPQEIAFYNGGEELMADEKAEAGTYNVMITVSNANWWEDGDADVDVKVAAPKKAAPQGGKSKTQNRKK